MPLVYLCDFDGTISPSDIGASLVRRFSTEDEAVAMAEAGADVLVPHMGLTTGGAIGAESAKTLDESVVADELARLAAE